MKKPLLSIVIPVYNRENRITDTLDSIIVQSVPNLHIVIVDNNSTDNTLAVVNDWKQRHAHLSWLQVTITSELTQGAAAARNKGFREVDSEWVEFFDSDDLMAPGHIPALIKAINSNPQQDIMLWQARLHLLTNKTVIAKTFGRNYLIDQIIHCPLSTYNFAVKAEFFKAAEAWNSKLRVWDDWETGVRLLLKSPKIKMISTPGVDVQRQEDSITGTSYYPKKGLWEKAIDEVSKEIEEGLPDSKVKKKAMTACNYRRAILAAEYVREGEPESGEALLRSALEKEDSFFNRLALRWAYRHTRRGLRGAWTILTTLKLV